MVMTDPIADMLTRIRNANSVYHDKVEIPASKIKKSIVEILKLEGFVKDRAGEEVAHREADEGLATACGGGGNFKVDAVVGHAFVLKVHLALNFDCFKN